MMTQTTREKIIELREQGNTCKETAEIVGVTEPTVWYTMRRSGLNGKIRHYRRGYQKPASIQRAVEEYGSVLIEEGLNGGYVVTINDVFVGTECGSIGSAIRSAAGVAGRAQ